MITILVPVFNEKEGLVELHKDIVRNINNLDTNYEVIFVDDGSTDNSLEILKEIAAKDKKVKVYSFRRNQGKAEALTFGFEEAKGDYIFTLDADLQDKPSEIPMLLKKIDEGWDLVCGWRRNRKDPVLKVIASNFFNYLATIFWGLKLHDYNCGLKLYKKEAAKSLHLYGGMHRFIPLLIHEQGFKICEIPVAHEKRIYGKSKYGFSKIWKDMPDILTMLFLSRYGKRPLHFFGLVGGVLVLAGIIILSYLSYIHFFGQTIGRRPLLFLGMLLVISGFQVFFTGFLADLILHISSDKKTQSEEYPLLKYKSD